MPEQHPRARAPLRVLHGRGHAGLTVLVQLSDPHIRVGAGDREPAEALAAAVRAVRALQAAPDAALVTGDLADDGAGRSYERVAELLAPLELPLHVLPGNHDDRDALRAVFGAGDVAAPAGAPVQGVAHVGDLRLVLCDTTIPGRDDGAYDAPRRAWLEAQLLAAPDTPTLVAMHHPPFAIGMPAMDELGVAADDRAALRELLPRFPQVRRVVCGHVHRTVAGTLGRVPALALSSVWLQARLELGAPEFSPSAEPANVALHVLVEGELVSHVQPVAR